MFDVFIVVNHDYLYSSMYVVGCVSKPIQNGCFWYPPPRLRWTIKHRIFERTSEESVNESMLFSKNGFCLLNFNYNFSVMFTAYSSFWYDSWIESFTNMKIEPTVWLSFFLSEKLGSCTHPITHSFPRPYVGNNSHLT